MCDVWMAHLRQLPDVEFRMALGMDGIPYELDLLLGKYYFEQFAKGLMAVDLTGKEENREYTGFYCVEGVYETRLDIDRSVYQLRAFHDYLKEQDFGVEARYSLHYNENLINVTPDSYVTNVSTDGDFQRLKSLALDAAQYRVALDPFSVAELTAAVQNADDTGKFTLIMKLEIKSYTGIWH